MRAEDRIADILLVRAVEECEPALLPPAEVEAAESGATPPNYEEEWVWHRAAHLLAGLRRSNSPLVKIVRLTRGVELWTSTVWILAFLAGVAANYLGPTDTIHVLFNPILLLVGWNLAVFAALGLRSALPAFHPRWRSRPRVSPPAAPGTPRHLAEDRATASGGAIVRVAALLLPELIALRERWTRQLTRARQTRVEIERFRRIAARFWFHWSTVARPILVARAKRLLHLTAIALTGGALLGIYVRGLFFDYNVVWRSTFIRDPDVVSGLLRILLGPGAFLAGSALSGGEEAAALMTREGVPAAPWIYAYTWTALVFIGLPRALLAARASVRIRRLARTLGVDLNEEYFRNTISRAWRSRRQRLEGEIRTVVKIESGKFAESVAIYVSDRLYDRHIVPEVKAFRAEGGKLADLEARIDRHCQAFVQELDRYLQDARHGFLASLSISIRGALGLGESIEEKPGLEMDSRIQEASLTGAGEVGGSLTRGLTDPIGMAVVGAVTVAIATMSGGFGPHVGVAILTGLLGTTGPVGWVMGAVLGLVIAVVGWEYGRDTVTATIKTLSVPGVLVRAALSEAKLDRLIAEGREKTHAVVKAVLLKELEPLAASIPEEVWSRLAPGQER